MIALKIDKFSNSFLMVSIEPGGEVYREAFHLQVKRPSAIAAACPRRLGVTIVRPDLVCISKLYLSLFLSTSQDILDLELFYFQLLAPTCSL